MPDPVLPLPTLQLGVLQSLELERAPKADIGSSGALGETTITKDDHFDNRPKTGDPDKMEKYFEGTSMVSSVSGRIMSDPKAVFTAFGAIIAVYFVTTCLYNLFLSPLRHLPGPKFAAASPLPFVWAMMRGGWNTYLVELHRKYGPVVRFGPEHISYADSQAQRDVHAPAGLRHAFDKHPALYQAVTSNEQSIFTSNGNQHERHRRILLRAFTDGAMQRLTPMIKLYIDMLMDRLGEHAAAKTPANMQDLLLFVTVDTASDFLFGEPFNMTRDGKAHSFVSGVLNLTEIGQVVAGLQQLRWFRFLWDNIIQYLIQPILQKHQGVTNERVARRLAKGVEAREDIIKYSRQGKETLNDQELFLNASHLWLAASETSTTSLAALVFFLLQHPEAHKRLVDEVRSAYATETDLADTSRLPQLKWVDACIKEAQRLHSPLPTPLPRLIPKGGATICGGFVPEGSCVVVPTCAASQSADNFHDPHAFRPQRWLDEDADFANDKQAAFQPFLLGPKSCIGKPMALLQMRWIAATIFWKYDLELLDESKNWIDQKVFVLWEQKPLKVNIQPRKV